MRYVYLLSSVLLATQVNSCGQNTTATMQSADHESEQLYFGDGFNSFTQKRARNCLEPFNLKIDARERGYKVNSSMAMYSTAKEAMSSLGINASGSASFIGATLNASGSFAKESLQKSFSIYIVANVTVARPAEVIENPRLAPQYIDLLKTNPDRFFEECGMTYVSEGTVGGSYDAIIQISSSTLEEKQTIAAGLQASGLGWNVKTDMTAKKFESVQQYSSIIVQQQIGGTGEGLTIPKDVAEVAERAATFPSLINENSGRSINLKFKSYNHAVPIELVNDTRVPDIENAVEGLSAVKNKIDQLAVNIEALDYIIENPSEFKGSDFGVERKRVIGARQKLRDESKKCMSHLTTCKVTEVDALDVSKYVIERTVVTKTLAGQLNVFAGRSDRSDQDLWGHVIVKIGGELINNDDVIYFHSHGTFEETGDTAHETHGYAEGNIHLYSAPEGWMIEKVSARTDWPSIANEVMRDDNKEKDVSGSEVPGTFHIRADRYGDDLPDFAGYEAKVEIKDVKIYLKRK